MKPVPPFVAHVEQHLLGLRPRSRQAAWRMELGAGLNRPHCRQHGRGGHEVYQASHESLMLRLLRRLARVALTSGSPAGNVGLVCIPMTSPQQRVALAVVVHHNQSAMNPRERTADPAP